jgi:hypothetical protein
MHEEGKRKDRVGRDKRRGRKSHQRLRLPPGSELSGEPGREVLEVLLLLLFLLSEPKGSPDLILTADACSARNWHMSMDSSVVMFQ